MIRAAFWPVKDRDQTLFQDMEMPSTPNGRSDRAGRRPRSGAEAWQDPDEDPEPKCHRLVTNDATVEAMSEILKDGDDTGKLTLLCDELVAFLGGFGRYTDRGAGRAGADARGL